MLLGGNPRIPVFNGTNAERIALTLMKAGDIFVTTDTNKVYTYTGALWTDVLSGVTMNLVLLDSTIIPNDTTESYTLSSITSGYKKFIIDFSVKMAANAETIILRLNNDSGNNYTANYINGEAVITGGSSGAVSYFLSGNGGVNGTTTEFNTTIFEITNATAAQALPKSIHSKLYKANVGYFLAGGTWTNTADEINRIDILSFTGGRKWKTGTKITIWGVK